VNDWLSVGDTVNTDKYKDVTITNIAIHSEGGAGDDSDALDIERVPMDMVDDYVTVTLDNGHWAHGHQIIKSSLGKGTSYKSEGEETQRVLDEYQREMNRLIKEEGLSEDEASKKAYDMIMKTKGFLDKDVKDIQDIPEDILNSFRKTHEVIRRTSGVETTEILGDDVWYFDIENWNNLPAEQQSSILQAIKGAKFAILKGNRITIDYGKISAEEDCENNLAKAIDKDQFRFNWAAFYEYEKIAKRMQEVSDVKQERMLDLERNKFHSEIENYFLNNNNLDEVKKYIKCEDKDIKDIVHMAIQELLFISGKIAADDKGYFKELINHTPCELEEMMKTEGNPMKKKVIKEILEEAGGRGMKCEIKSLIVEGKSDEDIKRILEERRQT